MSPRRSRPVPDQHLHEHATCCNLKGRVFRTHCSGPNFLEAAKREMPQALVLCTTGSRFGFGA